MSTDPTNCHRPLTPTQSVHYNPYEQTSPYGYDEIPIPPPPPPAHKPHRTWVIVAGVGICLAVILGGVLFAVLHAGIEEPAAHVATVTTPTALPALTAMQLYLVFRHNGLAGADGVENDGEYQPQNLGQDIRLHPEDGIVDFTDLASGQPYTISVFATSTEAAQAATILFNGGDNTYIPNGRCMLHVSFSSHASDFAMKGYTSIMDTMCKPS